MPRCEDFPCCGHAAGDCPDSQGRMTCVGCGKRLSKHADSSFCNKCLNKINTRDEGDLDHDFSMNFDY